MKLREVINAISGFKYVVKEYDIFPDGKIESKIIELKIDETNMRCRQYELNHESFVKGKWIVLTKEEFEYQLHNCKARPEKPKTLLRRNGQTIKNVKKLTFFDFVIPTNHFLERVEERFSVKMDHLFGFLRSVMDHSHFVVQGAELYNVYRDHAPSDAIICSLKHDCLIVVSFKNGRYILVTTYSAKTTPWFDMWFQDNLDKIETMPSIDQYFNFEQTK